MLTVHVSRVVILPSVKLRDAGVGSGVPPLSIARTSNVCAPLARRGARLELAGVEAALERRACAQERASEFEGRRLRD